MTTHEIVEYLRGLAEATTTVAEADDTNRVSRARLTMQATVLLEACDLAAQAGRRDNAAA